MPVTVAFGTDEPAGHFGEGTLMGLKLPVHSYQRLLFQSTWAYLS